MGLPTGAILGIGTAAVGATEDAFNYGSNRRRIKDQVKQVKSAQTANFLKSGVLLDGTPQKIIDETDRIGDEALSDLTKTSIAGGITDLGTNFLSGYKGGSTLSKLFKNYGGI